MHLQLSRDITLRLGIAHTFPMQVKELQPAASFACAPHNFMHNDTRKGLCKRALAIGV